MGVRKRIHDIFGQQVDERGHPISDAQATDPAHTANAEASLYDDQVIEIFDLAANQTVTQESPMKLVASKKTVSGHCNILDEVNAYLKSEEMDDEVYRETPQYTM